LLWVISFVLKTRAVLILAKILFNAIQTLGEISTQYAQRPIVVSLTALRLRCWLLKYSSSKNKLALRCIILE
jgi:hypothetical protein